MNKAEVRHLGLESYSEDDQLVATAATMAMAAAA